MERNHRTKNELVDALDNLSEEELRGLAAMIEDDPRTLRQALIDYGYLNMASRSGEGDGLVVNRKGQAISEPQRELAGHLEGELDPPKTVEEIIDIVGTEGSEFRQKYSSAQYRSWISKQLNALVKEGKIGRFREGRKVHYAETTTLAVKHWARLNELFPDELTVADVVDIKDDTGMPSKEIKTAVDTLSND